MGGPVAARGIRAARALDGARTGRRRPVWSIVCFVVGRTARGQGIAAALLAAAVDYARDHGATMLEAYPVDTGGGRVPSANVYHGTLSMFERAGFRVVERRQFNRPRPSVRSCAGACVRGNAPSAIYPR